MPVSSDLLPPAVPKEPLPFWKLDAITFQALCNEVLLLEPEVTTSDIYGLPGQTQRGIDILSTGQHWLTASQCKRYQSITARQVEEASKEFLVHWDYWQNEGVKRFILILSCDLSNRQLQDQILVERRRLAALGVQYECWSAAVLTSKLKRSPEVVNRYFDAVWANFVCGVDIISIADFQSLASHLGDYTRLVETEADRDFSEAKAALTKGQYGMARSKLSDLMEPVRFGKLTEDTRNKIYSLAARIAIIEGDLSFARQQVSKMTSAGDPEVKLRVAALTELVESRDPQAALDALSGARSNDTKQLQIGILIQSNRFDEANEILSDLLACSPVSPETYRLLAIIRYNDLDFDEARIALEKAMVEGDEAEQSESWKLTRATIDYWESICPIAIPPRRLQAPMPVDWLVIREDLLTREKLNRAANTFKTIAEARPKSDTSIEDLATWEIAALANIRQRDSNQQSRLVELSKRYQNHPIIIAWILACDIPVDQEAIRRSLEDRRRSNTLSAMEVNELSALMMRENDTESASRLLDESKAIFESEGMLEALYFAQIRIEAQRSELHRAEQLLSKVIEPRNRFMASLAIEEARARQSGDPSNLLELVRNCDETDPAILIDKFVFSLSYRDYNLTAKLGSELVSHVNTGAFAEVYATSLYNTQQFTVTLDVVRAAESRFASEMPVRMRRIEAASHFYLGHVVPSTSQLVTLVERTEDDTDIELLIRVCTTYGNFSTLTVLAHGLLKRREVSPKHLVALAQLFKDRDDSIFRKLLHAAIDSTLTDELAGVVYLLGVEADEPRTAELVARIETINAGPKPLMVGIQPQDLPQLAMQRHLEGEKHLKRYASADIQLHQLAIVEPRMLVTFLNEIPKQNRLSEETATPVFISYGSRPLADAIARVIASSEVCIDITAICVAMNGGFLEALIARKSATISRDLVPVLLSANLALIPAQPDGVRANEAILSTRRRNRNEKGSSATRIIADFLAAGKTLKPNEMLLSEFVYRCNNIGILAGATWEQVRKTLRLSAEPPIPSYGESPLQKGGVLELDASSAYLLAYSSALDELGIYYVLLPDSESEKRAEVELEEARIKIAQKSWIRSVIDRIYELVIAEKLRISKYRVLPNSNGADAVSELLDVLSSEPESALSGVVWVDDRGVNRYIGTPSGLAIVSSNEVLQYLRTTGAISSEQYYELLTTMREQFYCYIPLSTDEVVTALLPCNIGSDDEIIETRALRAIRLYLYKTFKLREQTQVASGSPGGLDETFYFDQSLESLKTAKIRVLASSDLAPLPKVRWLDRVIGVCVLGSQA